MSETPLHLHPILPRFIRIREAGFYLGMDKNRFNAEVRPWLTEIKIGTQGIAFDRLELDAWADDYKKRHGKPGKQMQQQNLEKQTCQRRQQGSQAETASGISIKLLREKDFTKALAQVTSKKRNAT